MKGNRRSLGVLSWVAIIVGVSIAGCLVHTCNKLNRRKDATIRGWANELIHLDDVAAIISGARGSGELAIKGERLAIRLHLPDGEMVRWSKRMLVGKLLIVENGDLFCYVDNKFLKDTSGDWMNFSAGEIQIEVQLKDLAEERLPTDRSGRPLGRMPIAELLHREGVEVFLVLGTTRGTLHGDPSEIWPCVKLTNICQEK